MAVSFVSFKKRRPHLRNQLRSSLLVQLSLPESNAQYRSSDEEHKLRSSEKVQTTTIDDGILQEALRLRGCSDCQEDHQRNESYDNDQHLQRHTLNDFHCSSSVYISRLRVFSVLVPQTRGIVVCVGNNHSVSSSEGQIGQMSQYIPS
jgi:hypothetical protein